MERTRKKKKRTEVSEEILRKVYDQYCTDCAYDFCKPIPYTAWRKWALENPDERV